MKLKNKIFNYFVVPSEQPNGMPTVLLAPITMSAKIARQLIEKQFKKQNRGRLPSGPLLHVCYDYDSQRIYVPNAHEFASSSMSYLLEAAKIRILKDFGNFANQPPIKGSPFSSLRVRSLHSFPHASDVVARHYGNKTFKDLPVIEAFLSRMPSTRKSLPAIFNKNDGFKGGYIGPDIASSVSFVEEIDLEGRKRTEPINLLSQSTPFILIDTSYTDKTDIPTATEKEWVVLSGYRDFLHDTKVSIEEKNRADDINKFADLYAIKRFLYLGWSFEEVSSTMLDDTANLVSLFKGIDRIMQSVDSLKQEGYKDVAAVPYYITFKIDESFPIKIGSVFDPSTGLIDATKQYPYFIVLDYDRKSEYVLIKTPAFITPHICEKILKAKSPAFIVRYNPCVNTIDVKTPSTSFEVLRRERLQLAKIKDIIKRDLAPSSAEALSYRGGDLASGISAVDPTVYNVRKVSDYLYASDYIMAMCKDYAIPFKDFNVIIGPIERVLGAGVQGGFMDENSFVKSKLKVPFEIAKGVFMSPPVILINSTDNPSYAEQTETLIHEYRHYLYGLQHPNYKMGYGRAKEGNGPDYEHWYNYFTDDNEKEAHKREIKFELGLGKSHDEIIRNKVGGQITMDNYPIALKFSEMVQVALNELEVKEEALMMDMHEELLDFVN